MTKMNILAKVGVYTLFRELNGTIVLEVGQGAYLCDNASAYETIKEFVGDPVERTEMIRQWSLSMNGGRS